MSLTLFCNSFADLHAVFQNDLMYHHSTFLVKRKKLISELTFRMSHFKSVDFSLKLHRDHSNIIIDTFRSLNEFFTSHKARPVSKVPNGESIDENFLKNCLHYSPITLKVFFKNEMAEGVGVTQSFFISISNALLSGKDLPSLKYFNLENLQFHVILFLFFHIFLISSLLQFLKACTISYCRKNSFGKMFFGLLIIF